MTTEEIKDIPEDAIVKAQVLNHMPNEYTDAAFSAIKECLDKSHQELVAKIEEIVPKFSNMAALYLFRRLMMEGGEKVKVALFNSSEVSKWVKKNQEALHRSIQVLP